MKISAIKLLAVLLLLITLASSLQLEQTHQLRRDFCWKDSYGRGVGTIPNNCGRREKIGALCYDRCPRGYKRYGFDCHQLCPSGWTNNGLFCRLAEYGRGGGYPWKFGDPLNDRKMYERCEKDHGKGRCEKNGLIVYPKCKNGYHSFGCCICRPSKPNCGQMGMNNGVDLSCGKKIRIGRPFGAGCPGDRQRDAGLCYKKCRGGYNGVGPVCWASNPRGWVNCGMGAAQNSRACKTVIMDQIFSVGKMALNIATLGTSGALSGAAQAAKLARLRRDLASLKTAFRNSKQVNKLVVKNKSRKVVKGSKGVIMVSTANDHITRADPNKMTQEDIVRLSAEIASLLDPTGVAGTVAAYTYPKCSKVFK